jgi:tetratricopeptide (TPR) repeat protein
MTNFPQGNIPTLAPRDIQALLKRGIDALSMGHFDEAGECCRKILSVAPKTVEAHFLVGLIANETKEMRMAIHAFGSVTTLDPKHTAGWTQLANALARVGQMTRADKALESAIESGTKDPLVEDMIGTVLSSFGDYKSAEHWYDRALKTAPKSPQFNMSVANNSIFLGENEKAEAALQQVLRMRPDQPQAHWRLSTLRRATDHSHLDTINSLMAKFSDRPLELSYLGYAAGKAYEDLQEWDDAFRCFSIGAKAKRQIIEYNESNEIRLFDTLRETYNPQWATREASDLETAAPIFIIGQPRTGTTLVERIVTSHSMAHSAGELSHFRLALWRNVKIDVGGHLPPELVAAAGSADPGKIGTSYMLSSKSMQGDLPRFVDKMPINYFFVPLILKALPNAKIVHLVRDPVDSCFSSFKQLFAEAYFHSYSLEEMARHHVRYRRLMDTWRENFPGQFYDIRYEDVVSDLETNARGLIDYLELPWEDACLNFHKQENAVSTASATQVREKAHTRSVNRWRKYEKHLQPALDILHADGLVD